MGNSTPSEAPAIGRRQFLKHARAVAWVVPTIHVVNMTSAAAAQTVGSVVAPTAPPPSTTTTLPCQPRTIVVGRSCGANDGGCVISGTTEMDGTAVRWTFAMSPAVDCNGLVVQVSAVGVAGGGAYPFQANGSYTAAAGNNTRFALDGLGTATICTDLSDLATLFADDITISAICL